MTTYETLTTEFRPTTDSIPLAWRFSALKKMGMADILATGGYSWGQIVEMATLYIHGQDTYGNLIAAWIVARDNEIEAQDAERRAALFDMPGKGDAHAEWVAEWNRITRSTGAQRAAVKRATGISLTKD